MDSLGSEIGQKMRSAVKAKLIELGTGSASGYIDDELPDYVMIMVANKRSRQQMIDDLTLFLAGQTEVFVNWLHQVLQKLEEVTLPAGSQAITATAAAAATVGGKEASKTVKESGGKRKGADQKKDKKKDKKTKRKEKSPEGGIAAEVNTPPHPAVQLGGVGSIQEVFANQYIQQAKKTLEIADSAPKKDSGQLTPPLRESSPPPPRRNDFDIPTISEIAGQTALQKHQKELSELEEIQQKIKQAKKQLKEMGSDESEDEDFLNIKANDEDLENIEDGGAGAAARGKRKTLEQEKARKQAEVPVEEERSTTPPAPVPAQKKKSILERLGSRPDPKPAPAAAPAAVIAPEPEQPAAPVANKSNIISLSAHRREERELYIPVFRRKEMEEQQQQQRAKSRETNRGRANRSRSRERDRRRRENSHDRSRNRREKERERQKERERHERERERSRGKVSNGASEVRTRIGSRVIVLPPKPEYVEEDELAVPIPSVIKIQPRPQVPKNKQPSKNLLLKAMAEAQRSTAANLKKTISNNRDESGSSSSTRPKRMLIEIPGNKPDGTPPTVDVRYAEEEDDDEDDIVNQVLLRDDGVDDELQQILDANDEYIPEPVTISISGRSDTDSDGYVYVPAVKKASSDEQTVPEPMDEYDPKFVVTLDGAYKKSSRASPSHTPPPPAASTSKPSIKDRIGKKMASSSDKATPPREDDRNHMETLKRRKERFSLKASAAAAAAAAAAKRSSSRSPEKRSSKSSSKRSPNKKRSSNSNNNSSSSSSKPSGTRTRASPADLNELLLQRTKELLVDDSVSSSPIYMSKSDYDKIEPNSSSRKRKRVSPIQFELTDDEADDSDGEYNHHRDREHRERKPLEPRISIGLDDAGRDERRRDHQRDSERNRTSDEGERRKGGGSNNGSGPHSEVKVSPTKKIKKLESSRKFDDVPQLLSSVSVPSDGLLASKSKGLIKERCKYFPSCRQGDSCEFLHPSTPCKAFPACKFGDNCLYLHPYCKYDKTCHRLDCNFMHSKPLLVGSSAGPSAPPLASSVVPVQNYKTITAKPLPALCKFYPGCTNGLCPYYHPKMCRFGRNCMNKVECNFYHHDLPGSGGPGVGAEFHEVHSKDKFKWISPFSA